MPNDSLLTPEEQATCEKISKLSHDPDSQRAQALLAINEGMTQSNAAQHTGLTTGQVRYCLKRFRELRTGIFSSSEGQPPEAAADDSATQAQDNAPPAANITDAAAVDAADVSENDTVADSSQPDVTPVDNKDGKKSGKKKSGKKKDKDKKGKGKKHKKKDKKKDKKSNKKAGKSKKGKKKKK